MGKYTDIENERRNTKVGGGRVAHLASSILGYSSLTLFKLCKGKQCHPVKALLSFTAYNLTKPPRLHRPLSFTVCRPIPPLLLTQVLQLFQEITKFNGYLDLGLEHLARSADAAVPSHLHILTLRNSNSLLLFTKTLEIYNVSLKFMELIMRFR